VDGKQQVGVGQRCKRKEMDMQGEECPALCAAWMLDIPIATKEGLRIED
jgi:hypothetical protein